MGGLRLPKGLLWGVLLGCLVLFGLAALGDWRRVRDALADFPRPVLAGALALAFGNYVLRYVRWKLYLHRLGVSVPRGQGAAVFFSGLAFSVSPGKSGELVKSYLLKRGAGIEVRRSAPVVVMERVTDFAGVLLLAAAGCASFGYGYGVLWVSAALLGGGLVLATSPAALERLLRFLPARFAGLRDSQAVLRSLLAPAVLAPSLVLAVLAWFAECLGFWLVMGGAGAPVSVPAATFVYAFATLVGAVTLLPGGLLTTESSMVALLTLLKLDRTTATLATLLIRFCTLWFAVLVGLAALWAWGRLTGLAGAAAVNDGEGVEGDR